MESKTKRGGGREYVVLENMQWEGWARAYAGGGKGAMPPPRPVNSELSHFSNLKLKSEEY